MRVVHFAGVGGAPPRRVDPVVLHLVDVPPDADAEREPTARQHVDARHLLGQHDRVVLAAVIEPHFISFVESCLQKAGLPPGLIGVEFSERVCLTHTNEVLPARIWRTRRRSRW